MKRRSGKPAFEALLSLFVRFVEESSSEIFWACLVVLRNCSRLSRFTRGVVWEPHRAQRP